MTGSSTSSSVLDSARTPPLRPGASTSGYINSSRRKEAESVKIAALPNAPQFRGWKLALRAEVAAASGAPEAGFIWIKRVEAKETTLEDLGDSQEFASLDAKLASALAKLTTGDLARTILLKLDSLASDDKLMQKAVRYSG